MPITAKYRYLILAVDHFSKFAVAEAVPDAKTHRIIRFLRNVFTQLGTFETVISDPGPQFRAKQLADFLAQRGIRHDRTGRRHFEGNGCLERLVRTLSEILAKSGAQNDTWPLHLYKALHAYNQRPHSATKVEPSTAFFRTAATIPLDAQYGTQGAPPPPAAQILANRRAHTAIWQQASQQRKRMAFEQGDIVLHCPRRNSTMLHARNRRFQPRRLGPYDVIEAYPRNMYLCTDGVKQYLLPGWELQLSP
jgi:hypothetical protein